MRLDVLPPIVPYALTFLILVLLSPNYIMVFDPKDIIKHHNYPLDHRHRFQVSLLQPDYSTYPCLFIRSDPNTRN